VSGSHESSSGRQALREHRQHVRLETDLACDVDGHMPVRVRNLSMGGALLLGHMGLAEPNEVIALEIAVRDANTVSVLGEVRRVVPRSAYAEYGVMFVGIEPRQAASLSSCIATLATQRGAGKRAFPRLQRRLALTCQSTDAFYATMNDLSRGGVGMECEHPLRPGDDVVVEISTGSGGTALKVPGVVAHVQAVAGGRVRAGLRFSPLDAAQQARLDALLQRLAQGNA
jgi:hypothetical protein